MTNQEIGTKLVALVNQRKNLEAIEKLYDTNIVSVEAAQGPDMPDAPDMPRTMEGIEAIKGKNQWWLDNHEIHNAETTGPFPHGDDRFATFVKLDVTFKPMNRRTQMEEVCLYTTKNGKIVKEEFFYSMG